MPSCATWASEKSNRRAPEEDVALYRSAAFVLHTYKLGETDQIVVLFTQEFGKLRAVARRSHSPRRHAASYYQPLMLLNAIVYGRPGQALYRMHSVDILQAWRPLHEDFGLLRCGLYMTELIDVATHEREPAPELFALFHQTLEQLRRLVIRRSSCTVRSAPATSKPRRTRSVRVLAVSCARPAPALSVRP